LAGGDPAPLLGLALPVGQVDEVLPGEEVPPNIGDLALDAWLVSRRALPGRVDLEASGLGVLEERVSETRLGGVGYHHDGRHVVGDDHREDTTEERPDGLEPLDHRLDRLTVGEIHEVVPAVAGGEDQCMGHPAPARGRI